MTDDKRPWTTNLGEIIAELNACGAPEPHIKAVENELIQPPINLFELRETRQ